MNAWFELVTEKNQLLRHENKLMIEQRELQLQVPYRSSPLKTHFEMGPFFSFWVWGLTTVIVSALNNEWKYGENQTGCYYKYSHFKLGYFSSELFSVYSQDQHKKSFYSFDNSL